MVNLRVPLPAAVGPIVWPLLALILSLTTTSSIRKSADQYLQKTIYGVPGGYYRDKFYFPKDTSATSVSESTIYGTFLILERKSPKMMTKSAVYLDPSSWMEPMNGLNLLDSRMGRRTSIIIILWSSGTFTFWWKFLPNWIILYSSPVRTGRSFINIS